MQKAREVKKSLKLKGFTEETGKDHYYYYLYHGSKKTSIFTKISHDASDIDDAICSQMAKQVRLKNSQFRELIDCPLTYESYIAFLMQQGILKPIVADQKRPQ